MEVRLDFLEKDIYSWVLEELEKRGFTFKKAEDYKVVIINNVKDIDYWNKSIEIHNPINGKTFIILLKDIASMEIYLKEENR